MYTLRQLEENVRLQRALDIAQGKFNDNDKVRPYIARCQKDDVESLSKIGMTPEDISYSLSLPISLVRSHKARIAEARPGGYLAILQR